MVATLLAPSFAGAIGHLISSFSVHYATSRVPASFVGETLEDLKGRDGVNRTGRRAFVCRGSAVLHRKVSYIAPLVVHLSVVHSCDSLFRHVDETDSSTLQSASPICSFGVANSLPSCRLLIVNNLTFH